MSTEAPAITIVPGTDATETPKVTPPIQAPGVDTAATRAETDVYIAQRTAEQKKKRGGLRERIDTLTRESHEAKEKLAEIEKKRVEAPPAAAAPPVAASTSAAAAVVVDDKPDPRPKRADFTDEGEFTAKIAEWVVRQQDKITAKPAAAAAPPAAAAEEIKFDATNPVHVQLKTEFDTFMTTGQEFIKSHTDFTDRLNAAAAKGLTLDNQAQRAIIKLAAPEVLYYLSDPANEAKARSIMTLDSVRQVIEIGLLYDKLKVNPKDYISDAPRPGSTRLTNGSTRATIPVSEMDTDDYIRQRREDIRSGRRRH